MDACGWDCLCSGPAFFIGLIYGNLDETYKMVNNWDKDKIINAYFEAPKKGFNTKLMGHDLLYWTKKLLRLSKDGLEKRDIINKNGKNEALFLKHINKIVERRMTNADHMINKFSENDNLETFYDT